MVPVQAGFLLVAAVSLPNLVYRAEFNVPLLLFAAALFRTRTSTAAYLFVLSLALDIYRLLTLLVMEEEDLQPQRKPILLVSTILAFTLKIALTIYLVIRQEGFRRALSPQGVIHSLGNALKGQHSQL